MRIVSLIASATEMVHALGLGEFQVGRSHECDYPPEVSALPVCTRPKFDVSGDSREIDARVKQTLATAFSVYDVFDEVLERLQPTHIVTQTQCEVCAVSLKDVERALGERFPSRPRVVALEPNSLADIFKDIVRLAGAAGVEERGTRLVQSMQQEMSAIAARARAAGRHPRVAAIEWQEPLMAAGNWVPELIEMLGAKNLFGTAGAHSPGMTWDDLAASDADAIVAMPCGYDIPRTRAEMHWLTDRAGWSDLRAVREGRVFLADGNQYLNRPGPRVVESLRILAEILFPQAFEPRLNGVGWERAESRRQKSEIRSPKNPVRQAGS
ncbi:MAG TPA: cobalamin-binding protein [Bryobacteraceae bacterium]|nr:cobalamin-binding protein [Bryobacteraceae bacterium]